MTESAFGVVHKRLPSALRHPEKLKVADPKRMDASRKRIESALTGGKKVKHPEAKDFVDNPSAAGMKSDDYIMSRLTRNSIGREAAATTFNGGSKAEIAEYTDDVIPKLKKLRAVEDDYVRRGQPLKLKTNPKKLKVDGIKPNGEPGQVTPKKASDDGPSPYKIAGGVAAGTVATGGAAYGGAYAVNRRR